MPHVELKYTDDLEIDTKVIFQEIEQIVNQHDDSAGACKSRGFKIDEYLHTHISIWISLLPKKHRNQAFLDQLSQDLETKIKELILQECFFAIELVFSGPTYITNTHSGS